MGKWHMPLTHEEREACRQSQYMSQATHAYGSREDGYCPIGAVAVLRGATFAEEADGTYHAIEAYTDAQGQRHLRGVPDCPIIMQAQEDVLAWTGHASLGDFLRALEASGSAVFPLEAG